MIMFYTERVVRRIRDLFAKSLLLQLLCSSESRINVAFSNSHLRNIGIDRSGTGIAQNRFPMRCLRAFEDSALLRLQKSACNWLLETSVGSFGVFGILCGAFSASLWFVRDTEARNVVPLFASLILTVVSVPLLHAGHSLSYVIRHSVIVRKLLIDGCMISEDAFGRREQGAERQWTALFCGVLVGGVSLILPSHLILLGLLICLVLLLLFAVPELSFLLTLLFLPFLNLLAHPSLILGCLVLISLLTWLPKALCGRRHLRFSLTDLLVLLFLLLVLAGGAVGAGGREGLFGAMLSSLLILSWFPAVSFFSQQIWRKRAIGALLLSGSVCAALGIVQYFFTDMELLWTDTARFADIKGRVCATFSNPNILAVYLLLLIPLALGVTLDLEESHASRFGAFLAFFSMSACLILTWSRGAWLGLLVAVLLFLISFTRRSCGALLVSVLPCIAVLPFLPHNIINRFSSIGSFSESSIRYRLYTWRGVLRMLRAHPWGIGTGEAAFHSIYPQYAVSGTESVMHTHQLFLQIPIEHGVIGAAVFGCFLLMLFLMVARGLRGVHGSARAVLLGSACAVLAGLVMGMFDHIWYHSGNLLLFFVICALLTVCGEEKEAR